MPYAELDQKDGEFELGFDARIYDEVTKAFLATSPHAAFRYSQRGENQRGDNLGPAQVPVAGNKPVAPDAVKSEKAAPPTPKTKPAGAYKPPDPEEMRATFQQSYGWENPSEDQNLFLDAIALDWAGKSGAAEKLVKKAIELNPKEPRYWQNLVMGAIGKQKYDQAQKHIHKALEHMPESPYMLTFLGRTHMLKGEFAEAQAVALRLKGGEGESAQIQYNYLSAEIAEKQQDYKTAIRFYDKADSMLNPETQKAMGFNQKRCRDLMKAAKKK